MYFQRPEDANIICETSAILANIRTFISPIPKPNQTSIGTYQLDWIVKGEYQVSNTWVITTD